MFCALNKGAFAVIVCLGDIAHKFTDKTVHVHVTEIRTRRYGAYEVHATFAPLVEDASPKRCTIAKAVYRGRQASDLRTSTSPSCRTSVPAPEVIQMDETVLCADGEQEKLASW